MQENKLSTVFNRPVRGMLVVAALLLSSLTSVAQGQGSAKGNVTGRDTTLKYIRSNNGFVMLLRQGEDVLDAIKQLAIREKIDGANFSALGFVEAEFGYFNNQTKKYDPKKVKGELASMTGSVAWNADTVSLHTHAIVTDRTFQAYGGHLLQAKVGTGSVEIFITATGQPLGRKIEQPLGANVLQLKEQD